MAKLNLSAEWVDNRSIRVKWDDWVRNRHGRQYFVVAVLIMAALITFSLVVANLVRMSIGISPGNTELLWVSLVFGTIIALFWHPKTKHILAWGLRKWRQEEAVVVFGIEVTQHNENKFETSQISRIEMGQKYQLKGYQPPKEGEETPFLIRIWIEDRYEHQISENIWDIDTNHRIRNTLADALEKVRSVKRQEEKDHAYGRVESDGVPDYD